MNVDSAAFDYSEDIRKPTNQVLAELNAKVSDLVAAEKAMREAEEALKQATTTYRNLREAVLPELMADMGFSSLRTVDGVDVELEEDIHAHISEERNEAAIQWLDANGHGDLVKRQFIVKFDRAQESLAKKFQADLKKRKVQLQTEMSMKVHPSTLKSFVKKALQDGEDIPIDTFGVHRRTVAKITISKD